MMDNYAAETIDNLEPVTHDQLSWSHDHHHRSNHHHNPGRADLANYVLDFHHHDHNGPDGRTRYHTHYER